MEKKRWGLNGNSVGIDRTDGDACGNFMDSCIIGIEEGIDGTFLK